MRNKYNRSEHRKFVKNTDEEKKDVVKKLKNRIKGLEREVNILRSEKKTLQKALDSSLDRIKDLRYSWSIEDIIDEIKDK